MYFWLLIQRKSCYAIFWTIFVTSLYKRTVPNFQLNDFILDHIYVVDQLFLLLRLWRYKIKIIKLKMYLFIYLFMVLFDYKVILLCNILSNIRNILIIKNGSQWISCSSIEIVNLFPCCYYTITRCFNPSFKGIFFQRTKGEIGGRLFLSIRKRL